MANTSHILTENQRNTGHAMTEEWLKRNLPAIRKVFNEQIEQAKESVIIGKSAYVTEYVNGVRHIGGAPEAVFIKTLSPKEKIEFEKYDAAKSELNNNMFKLIHDSMRRAYLWGIHDTVSEGFKFGLKQIQKPKFVYDADKYGDLVRDVINYMNDKVGTKYLPTTTAHINLICDRAIQGYVLEDFKKVIDRQCHFWLNSAKMIEYLRPKTLFSEKNFVEYVHGISKAGENGNGEGPNPAGTTGSKVGGGTRQNRAFEKLQGLKRE